MMSSLPRMAAPRPRVVFLPGVMGSTLADENGNVLWVKSGLKKGKGLETLAITGNGFDDGGGIQATGFVPHGGAYNRIADLLRQHADYLAYPYDWRLSIIENGRRLRSTILEKWPDAATNKVNLVAHSMGGLVARAFVESDDTQIQGYRYTQRVITAGTPHLGAPQAVAYLLGLDYPFWIQKLGGITMKPQSQKLLLNACASTIEVLPNMPSLMMEARKKVPKPEILPVLNHHTSLCQGRGYLFCQLSKQLENSHEERGVECTRSPEELPRTPQRSSRRLEQKSS